MTPRVFGDFALEFVDCSALSPIPVEAAKESVTVVQLVGGTFLYAGEPDPDPWQRIDSQGNIWPIDLKHESLHTGSAFGATFAFLGDERDLSVGCDISFADARKVDDAATSFLQFAQLIYPHLEPAYGWIDEVGTRLHRTRDVPSRKLEYIFWANFFGPPYVERYGRDFLLGAPGWRVEELRDGGILYVLSPSFVNLWQVVREKEVLDYFRRRVPGVRPYRRVRDKVLE